MKNPYDEEIEPHDKKDCPYCDNGSGFYKTPFGCRGDECEDEDNCYCECHEAV